MSYVHIPQYRGESYAVAYWQIWNKRTYIHRRVDTYKLLDAETVQLSATFDISQEHLWNSQKVNGMAAIGEGSNPVPIMILKKQPLFDIDCVGSQGRPIHFCRRYENINISAHIITGMVLFLRGAVNAAGDRISIQDQESIYELSLLYLGYERISSEKEKNKARIDLIEKIKTVWEELGKAIPNEILSLINFLNQNYIQCIHHNYSESTDIQIIKIRTISAIQALEPSPGDRHSDLFAEGIWQQIPEFRLITRKVWAMTERASQFFSISGFRVIVTIPGADLPNHVRVISAKGTILDEITLRRQDKSPYPGDVLVARHGERGSLLLRIFSPKACELVIKLNPRSQEFLIPALIISLIQLSLFLLAVRIGPDIISRNSATFTGTSVVSPFVSALFLIRESEHALVTRLLKMPRLALLLLSVSTVISGAFIGLIPKEMESRLCVTEFNADKMTSWTFYALTMSMLLATLSVLGYSFLLYRMAGMRKFTAIKSKILSESRNKTIDEMLIDLQRIRRNERCFRVIILLIAGGISAIVLYALALFLHGAYFVWHPFCKNIFMFA